MLYHSVREVLEARRKGVSLNVIIDSLLQTPRVWEEHLTPFSLIQDLQKGDYVDISTPTWLALPVDRQMELAKGYQWWYAHRCGLADIYHTISNGVSIKMVLIPPMLFGASPEGKPVLIENPFWMGESEVTQGQWLEVMGGENPSEFQGDLNLPVERVGWNDCQNFCKKTKTKIPTEDQWELACRAGTTTRWSFGDEPELTKGYSWYKHNAKNRTHPVKKKPANAFGLYDMHGNVNEWCQSKFALPESPRVIRGGSWGTEAFFMRSSYRYYYNLVASYSDVGFRVMRSFSVKKA